MVRRFRSTPPIHRHGQTPIGMGKSGVDDDYDANDDEMQGFSKGLWSPLYRLKDLPLLVALTLGLQEPVFLRVSSSEAAIPHPPCHPSSTTVDELVEL
jgi:hypothetical protein